MAICDWIIVPQPFPEHLELFHCCLSSVWSFGISASQRPHYMAQRHGYITGDISDMFGVSLQSIQRWQSNFNQYGSGGALITQ